MLNSSPVFSQIGLRKGNHECRSHSLNDRPLLDAIRAGHYVLVKRLLQQGANANARDDCGVSAVTYAAAILHPGILKELIAAGATVNVIDDFYHKPPLLWALEDNEVEQEERVYEIAKLLAEAGTDVNLRGTSTQTGLIMAARKGLNKVAELLISKGAKIDARDDEGRTAYSYAAQLGNSKLKNLLIGAGADTKIGVAEYKRNFGKNAFIQAASDGRTDIVEAMLADGTKVDTANEAGVTALMRIVEDSTLDALLAAGADVNKSDNAGFTALVWASFDGRASQVKKLIAAGADVNAITHDGKTPLNMAKPQVRGILIEAGAKY
jgi:ankyrin repeat protein